MTDKTDMTDLEPSNAGSHLIATNAIPAGAVRAAAASAA